MSSQVAYYIQLWTLHFEKDTNQLKTVLMKAIRDVSISDVPEYIWNSIWKQTLTM